MSSVESIYELFSSYPKITTDSRNIERDSIFFALHGVSFDGNDYALQAIERGAAYAVVDRTELASQDDRLIVVEDTLVALQELALLHRQRLAIPIVAITGSNGKTTTKELLAATLATNYSVFATKGNLNNHIGVPLTLLSMDRRVEVGIVEMGASAQGEIALLCSIAQPNYGVITNIGRAHLEGFGGVEGIKRGKGELFEWLSKSEGVAFIPEEDSIIQDIAARFSSLQQLRYSYSLSEGVESNLEGEYNLKNIATAIAISSKLGASRIFIHKAISKYIPTNNRSQRIVGENNTIIADCYNANPSSMEAAIDNFAKCEEGQHDAGKILILGDMLELGEWSLKEHTHVIELALALKAKKLWLVGDNFKESYQAMGLNKRSVKLFESQSELSKYIARFTPKGFTILIKGSHSIGLERVIDALA